MPKILLHIQNEDPVVGEMDALPNLRKAVPGHFVLQALAVWGYNRREKHSGFWQSNRESRRMASFPFLSPKDGGTLLEIYVQPKAARSELAGEREGRLKVRISAPPVEGEANRECIAFLSRILDVPKSGLRPVRGERGRLKAVLIARPPESIAARIEKLLAQP